MNLTARDFSIKCGSLPSGTYNAITDVAGVKVGHLTIQNGSINTGVTAIIPHSDNIFRRKLLAASETINGFGKTAGLVQVNELGTLETPILLTNTLSVGTCVNALIRRAIIDNPDIGRNTSTVNAVVGECNDGPLNDIQAMAITEDQAFTAIDTATTGTVMQGNVGAGTGMTCFGFKGGIGTTSRRIRLDSADYHLGILVLSNFGCAGDLVLPDGRRPDPNHFPYPIRQPEQGSVMIILATDIPLEHRQLQRVIRRCGAGIARLGAFWGHGSGDIVIGFSTAVSFDHDEPSVFIKMQALNENRIDLLFQAAAEATQEAVLNSMCAASAMTGRDGNHRVSLADWLKASSGTRLNQG